jgi:hypothetical protein
MKDEMDLLRFDERQRLAWLMANRGTVIAVGLTWIGLIVWELTQDRVPLFMIAMVPVFALCRVALFFYYCSTSGDRGGANRGDRLGDYLKIGGSVLLLLALFLPLCSYPAPGVGMETDHRYVWDLVFKKDWTLVFPLGLAFFWPFLTRFLSRRSSSPRVAILAQWAEPLLAATSILIVLLLPQILFEARRLFWVFFVFETARPRIGSYVAVSADGLYLVGWLASALRPYLLQPRDVV